MNTLSIIIPAYNAGRTLNETLESVFSQTAPGVEVIVVDDGSPDDTAKVAKSFPGVRLLKQENTGPGGAVNHGVAKARGEFLIFLDADDLLAAGAVSSHLAHLSRHWDGDGFVGYMEEFICPSESAETARRLQPRQLQPCWLAGGVMLRSQSFRKVGTFDARLRVGHWVDWMHRAKLVGLAFHVHQAIVLRRRLHSGSLSMRHDVSNGKGLITAARNALLRRRQADSEKTESGVENLDRVKT